MEQILIPFLQMLTQNEEGLGREEHAHAHTRKHTSGSVPVKWKKEIAAGPGGGVGLTES